MTDTHKAQPEKEPVAEAVNVPRDLIGAACSAIEHKRDAPNVLEKLRRYTVGDLSLTTPPQRTWVGLTDEESVELMRQVPHLTIGGLLAIEAKLKEKNT